MALPLPTPEELEAVRQAQREAVYGHEVSAPLLSGPDLTAPLAPEEMVALVAAFREAGEQWARTGVLALPEIAAAHASVEMLPDGTPTVRAPLVGIGAVNGAYGHAIAERYLHEAGLETAASTSSRSPAELLAERPALQRAVEGLTTRRTDSPAERVALLEQTSARLYMLSAYASQFTHWCMERQLAARENRPTPAEPLPPEVVSPEELAALGAVLRRIAAQVEHGGPVLLGTALERELCARVPFMATLREEVRQLTAECERPATLEDVDEWTLTRHDGTRAPAPEAWLAALAAAGEQHRADAEWWLYNGLEELAKERRNARVAALEAEREELARQLEEERARADAAELKAARERRKRKEIETGLPDRTVFPGHLWRSGLATPKDWERLAEQIDAQTDLFPYKDALEKIRAKAEITDSLSQLSDMTAAEVRAMHGVFRLFTREGDDHKTFNTNEVSVDAALLYKAAGITSRRAKDRTTLFDGLRALGRRTLMVALKVKDKDGKYYVIGDQTAVVEMKPIWRESSDKRRPLTEAEAETIATHYTRHMADGTPWTGPLPDRFVFTLPNLMQRISERLVLRGDVLDRLEAGSRAVRGSTAGLNTLDHRLLIEIIQRAQARQRSEDGLRVRCFVDREKVLADHYGAAQLAKWRKAGKYRERATIPYENAARALVAGGLMAHWTPSYRTSEGELRDVFEPVPGVVPGLEKPLPDPAQTALPLRKRSRRPRSKKGDA